jgi:hypothetical protein
LDEYTQQRDLAVSVNLGIVALHKRHHVYEFGRQTRPFGWQVDTNSQYSLSGVLRLKGFELDVGVVDGQSCRLVPFF